MGGRPLLFIPTAELLRRQVVRDDEVGDVRQLLLDHADAGVGTATERAAVAETVALACLGDNHLWQDLQLPNRSELGVLLRLWFPALAAKNVHDMKWKKFFYKQLCEREELFVCRAPSCAVCSDHDKCFGPEEGPA